MSFPIPSDRNSNQFKLELGLTWWWGGGENIKAARRGFQHGWGQTVQQGRSLSLCHVLFLLSSLSWCLPWPALQGLNQYALHYNQIWRQHSSKLVAPEGSILPPPTHPGVLEKFLECGMGARAHPCTNHMTGWTHRTLAARSVETGKGSNRTPESQNGGQVSPPKPTEVPLLGAVQSNHQTGNPMQN